MNKLNVPNSFEECKTVEKAIAFCSGELCSVAESVHTSNALKMLHKKMCDLESTNTPAYWISYGRDEKYNRYYKCSRCMHEIVIDTEFERYVGLPDTCEVCGAKMCK